MTLCVPFTNHDIFCERLEARFPLNFSLFLSFLFSLSLSLIFTEVFFPLRTRYFLAQLLILIMSTIHLFLVPMEAALHPRSLSCHLPWHDSYSKSPSSKP